MFTKKKTPKAEREKEEDREDGPDEEFCFFCGKPASPSRHLIAGLRDSEGPIAWICYDCVAVCAKIVALGKEKPAGLHIVKD